MIVRVAVSYLLLIPGISILAQEKADRPMEETKKNIHVLKGVPSSQLIPIMTVMANSLGVTCAHCHEAKWESDAKPAKEAARRMITLTRGLNDQYYAAKTVVTCNTCHRGHVETAAVPAIADAGWNKPRFPATVAAALPNAEELFALYRNAAGDVAKIAKRISSGVASGYSGRTDASSATFELTQELPDPVALKMELSYPQQADREFISQFFNQLRIRERYGSVRTVGHDVVRGQTVFVVEAQAKEEVFPERLYFDAARGYLLRRERQTPTLVGPLPEQYDFDDYRLVDGVAVPFLLQWSRADYQVTHRIASVKHEMMTPQP